MPTKQALQLARAFADVVDRVMEDDELERINAENARRDRERPHHGTCATHDVCDANELMFIALGECNIPFFDEKDEHVRPETMELINEAWKLARAAGFNRHKI